MKQKNIKVPLLKDEIGSIYPSNGKSLEELFDAIKTSLSDKGTFVQIETCFLFEGVINSNNVCLILTIFRLKDEISNNNFVVHIRHCKGDRQNTILLSKRIICDIGLELSPIYQTL
jgi:hypothetical protein